MDYKQAGIQAKKNYGTAELTGGIVIFIGIL
jgi:hypothetical protein